MNNRLILILVSAFAIGCSSPIPTEGNWESEGEIEMITSECNLNDSLNEETSNESLQMKIEMTEEGFLIDDQLNCVFEGPNFTCDEERNSEDLSALELDAALISSLLASGKVNSSTSMELETILNMTCEGDDSDCEAAAAFYENMGVPLPCENHWRLNFVYVDSE